MEERSLQGMWFQAFGWISVGARKGFPVVFWILISACGSPKQDQLNVPLMTQAMNVIQREYVNPKAADSEAMTYGAISGMVDALGDTGHSSFLTPGMVKDLEQADRRELKGVGIEIQIKGRRTVVVAPIDNSPAQEAGFGPGDVILKIDDKDISDWPIAKVVEHIRGREGTLVRFTVLDAKSGVTRDVTVMRAAIKLHEVTWRRLPGTGIVHLRISSFEKGATRELRKALAELRRDRDVKGIVLDMRNNPGGLLDEAVGVASLFLTNGSVVLIKDAKGAVTSVPVKKGAMAPRLPTAVLINNGTASAAEIVAGALRDANYGPLIGEQTFGTGTVLQEFRLKGGSALLLAVEEWLTPRGQSFWHKGLEPAMSVSLPDDSAMLIPQTERKMTADQLRASGDRQLLSAVDWLEGRGGRNAVQKKEPQSGARPAAESAIRASGSTSTE